MDRLKEFQQFCVDYMDFEIDHEFEYCWEIITDDDEYSLVERYLTELNQTNDFDIIVNEFGGIWNMIQKIKNKFFCPFMTEPILKELFILTTDEDYFHFKLLSYYYEHVFLREAKEYTEQKFIFYRRLHYNRFLNESCLPDEICDMIREHL